jgi:hypothetical protein
MAKKNKNDNPVVGCLAMIVIATIVITIIAVQLIPIVVPLASAVGALVFFIIYMINDKPHVRAKFELSSQEKLMLANSAKNYRWALDKIEELNRVIKDEGLRYTKSGRLELRSHRAQDVQGAMDNANHMIEEERPTYNYLMGLPSERYEKAQKHFACYWGCFIAFAIWGCLILSQPRTEMLDYHTYQTAEAVSRVTSVLFENKNDVDRTNDAELNTDTKTDENNNDKQQEGKPLPVKPDITIWKAFLIWLIAYVIVFVTAIFFFSSKNKEPKSLKS